MTSTRRSSRPRNCRSRAGNHRGAPDHACPKSWSSPGLEPDVLAPQPAQLVTLVARDAVVALVTVTLVLPTPVSGASAARRRGAQASSRGRAAGAQQLAPPRDGTPPDTQVGSWARTPSFRGSALASRQVSGKAGELHLDHPRALARRGRRRQGRCPRWSARRSNGKPTPRTSCASGSSLTAVSSSCPPGPSIGAVEPKRSGIIIRVSGVRVPPPA